MSSVNDALYIGMGPPNGLLFEVRKLDGDTWDPTVVATVSIRALPPSGVAKTFAGTISSGSQSATGLDVEYALAEDDLDEVGEWRFYLKLIDADDGVVRTICQARTVRAEFGL